ncbi:hypothetical protein SAMN05660772_01856 [Pasteurella testudinis DSM 23072]|uniref:Uncharacterized protein n=1 Tax=Pasteurella testudinis DSM 23072 TaxID=1122938 RepID=A0A1W1UKX3_9PAST|nr:hypothetical protein [Pasteurella testudinis]SMB81451.1 hypothetical protein SAMN05660772_01856 [Pasteurella testudinis DSM 23072]SUB51414.1 Uncharacterised protein [Pasteurella testudinis]
MTELLWLLYFADISKSLEFAAVVLFLAVALLTVLKFMIEADSYNRDSKPTYPRWQKVIHIVAITIFTCSLFLPSKHFIYSAVALKTAATVAETPLATEAMQAAQTLIKRYVDETKANTSKEKPTNDH